MENGQKKPGKRKKRKKFDVVDKKLAAPAPDERVDNVDDDKVSRVFLQND